MAPFVIRGAIRAMLLWQTVRGCGEIADWSPVLIDFESVAGMKTYVGLTKLRLAEAKGDFMQVRTRAKAVTE